MHGADSNGLFVSKERKKEGKKITATNELEYDVGEMTHDIQ
jgi:hypothetical protein